MPVCEAEVEERDRGGCDPPGEGEKGPLEEMDGECAPGEGVWGRVNVRRALAVLGLAASGL
jgi:hypothetical protein